MKGFRTLAGLVGCLLVVPGLGAADPAIPGAGVAPRPALILGRPVPVGQPVTPPAFPPAATMAADHRVLQAPRPIVRAQGWEDMSGGAPPPPPAPCDDCGLPGGVPGCAPSATPGAIWDVPSTVCVPEQPQCEPECRPIHCYVFGDFLWIKPRGADVPYAQPRDGVTPLAVPKGPVAVADFDYSWGARAGAGYGFSDRSFIQGSFTWFDTSATSSVTAPAGTFLHSLITFPATMNVAADSLSASTRYDIDFQLIDGEFKHMFCRGENYFVAWLVGARYAHLDQQFRGDFTILGTTTVTTNIEFDGIGPRVGLEGECHSRCGVFVFGRGFANFLVGQFKGTYLQTNVFAGVQANTSFEDSRVVPNFDLELGLGWQTRNGRLRIMAGYYLSCWFNTLTTSSFIQGVQNSNFTTNGDNFRDRLIFDGLMARVEVRF